MSSEHLQFLNQFWWSIFILVPMVLVARTVVAGTRYSPILIIVVFGLLMGHILVSSGVTTSGLPDFPLLNILSRTTIVALAATFFVGGQQLRRVFSKNSVAADGSVVYCVDEVVPGTGRTQLVFIVRAFFLLLGIEALSKYLLGLNPPDDLGRYYPLIAYLGLVISVIFIDNRAIIDNKQIYLRRGLVEMVALVILLIAAHFLAAWVRPFVALPQIFFVMILASALGTVFYELKHGPAVRCLLFAGIPIILAANFLVGGSLISGTLQIEGIAPTLIYGFFGQVMWMFGGIALLMLIGGTASIRNLAPGMAGALSHAGLTGACTAGDFGEEAARRAPVMINIPFFGHIFVFSLLAMSIDAGAVLVLPVSLVALAGVVLTLFAFRTLRSSGGGERAEITGLMLFSLGWQLVAVFGGLLLLTALPLSYAGMAKSAALSHFGLFAAIQGGMFGAEAAALITFVFAMPFLVHPLVFFLFGRAMENQGEMPRLPVYVLTLIGVVGVTYGLIWLS
ncbi:hypothetical protein GC175_33110 [bacterium]|nr:hypothetical protein [bacterium]